MLFKWLFIILAIAGVLLGAGELIGTMKVFGTRMDKLEIKADNTENTLFKVEAHYQDLKDRLIRIETKLDKI